MLSNNRKYLSTICKEGIDNDYRKIKFWLNDIDTNINILLKLIKLSDDGLNMSYGIIGSPICSDNEDVSLKSIKLINNIYRKTGNIDNNWLKNLYSPDIWVKLGICSFVVNYVYGSGIDASSNCRIIQKETQTKNI